MGLMVWIRAWWRRRWIPTREFEEYKRAVCSTVDGERYRLRANLEQAKQTIRDLTAHNVKSLAEIAVVEKKTLAAEVSRDLANIITTVGLVGCRLDALAGKIGCGLSGSQDETIPDDLKALGFVPRSAGVVGCNTIPCFQGKMPDQADPDVPCAIITAMCHQSPRQQMTPKEVDDGFESIAMRSSEKHPPPE